MGTLSQKTRVIATRFRTLTRKLNKVEPPKGSRHEEALEASDGPEFPRLDTNRRKALLSMLGAAAIGPSAAKAVVDSLAVNGITGSGMLSKGAVKSIVDSAMRSESDSSSDCEAISNDDWKNRRYLKTLAEFDFIRHELLTNGFPLSWVYGGMQNAIQNANTVIPFHIASLRSTSQIAKYHMAIEYYLKQEMQFKLEYYLREIEEIEYDRRKENMLASFVIEKLKIPHLKRLFDATNSTIDNIRHW